MSIYRNFCREVIDENGKLLSFSINCPDNFNFAYDVVDCLASNRPDKTALVWKSDDGSDKVFTFSDISELSSKCANVLREYGIKRGDSVILALKKHYEYWYTVLALHKLGAAAIPVTHMLTSYDFRYRIEQADVKGIICTSESEVPEKVWGAVNGAYEGINLWTVHETIPGFMNLTDQIKSASPFFSRVETSVNDRMMIYFTSGTTGHPKGVIHDFSYPLSHIVTAKYWQRAYDGGLHFTLAESGWAKASWGKIYGQWLVGSAVMVHDFNNFDPKKLCDIINEYGVTGFCAPPTVYRYLLKKDMPDMPSLRTVTTAGEVMNEEIYQEFTARTGLTPLTGYGQTETSLQIANFEADTSRLASMGKPSPMYDIFLLTEDGREAADNEEGEIVIRPSKDGGIPGVFTGYLNNDELYKKVWSGGVYHTGDSAYRDEAGTFWFIGRLDDVIKTGGYRVGPYEIEEVLLRHPAVYECRITGVPDEQRGQAIKAAVVLNAGFTGSKQLDRELKEFVNSRLSEYKWLRIIEFVTSLPKTISGKIIRRKSK